jgi:hypothetical protein
MSVRPHLARMILAAAVLAGPTAAAQAPDRRQTDRIEEALRLEGQAVVALADGAPAAHGTSGDFVLSWHHDHLKALSGTFVPFTVRVGPAELNPIAVLLYVRLAPRPPAAGGEVERAGARTAEVGRFPFEEIYPLDGAAATGEPRRFIRGFSIAPGDYELTLVVRERERREDRGRRRKAAILRRPVSVPDYSRAELATSSIIMADALTALPTTVDPEDLPERPYVIGVREITPAADAVFRRTEELIVVFLIYYPAVAEDKQFDLEVEYHFFRRTDAPGGQGGPPVAASIPAARPDEVYVNRTEPQRFTPLVLGSAFDPAAGQPVLAGQGVPLAGFREGDYRLAIAVTDRISGRTLAREITFTVRS